MNAFFRKNFSVFAALVAMGGLVSYDVDAADVGKLVEDCANCHGKDGASTESTIPIIGGMSEFYLSESEQKDNGLVANNVRLAFGVNR